MPTLVGPKGQVVIEKEIRDRLGIATGAVAIQTLVGDRVEIRFIPPEHTESLFGVLAHHARPGVAVEGWADVSQRAWEVAAKEKEASARIARRGQKRQPRGRARREP
jgi:bifunctional DNA-binding transcriptional regulator/antitoxin component of YhaV-PrlF toxin-antitoxin module